MQRLFLVLNLLIVAGAIGAALALDVTEEAISSIPRTSYGNSLVQDAAEGEPLNFLLIGSDSASTLPDDHPLRRSRPPGLRTDTMMVLRIDPVTSEASVLSIARDLWVPVAGYSQNQKLTDVMTLTDLPTLVQTIREYLQIPLHHVVSVDFNGFLEMIEILGGVPMRVDYPLRDIKGHLSIPETGCINLTPEQALGLVRARHLDAKVDGRWTRVDGRGDYARIERQQDFLVLAMDRAFEKGVRNPSTLKALVGDVAAGGFVNLDERLTFQQVLDLADEFSDFASDGLAKYTLPIQPELIGEEPNVKAVSLLYEGAAKPVLDVFRGTVDDQAFRLFIRNGSGEAGLAGEVKARLEALDFRIVSTGNAESFDFWRTIIVHGPSQTEQAELLASWLVRGADLQPRRGADVGVVELIIGRDWSGVRSTRAEPTPAPTATPAPTPEPGGTPGVVPTPLPTPTAGPLVQVRSC